jgi:hypothetical protein
MSLICFRALLLFVLGGIIMLGITPTPGLARAAGGTSFQSAASSCPPPPPDDSIPVPPWCRPRAATVSPSDICLRLSTAPASAIRPSEIVAYLLIAHNSGHGDAKAVQVVLPFAPDQQNVIDAAFTSPDAWVSAVLTDTIELRLEALKRDQTITATLWLRTSPDARPGQNLSTRARFGWDGKNKGVSNRVSLLLSQSAVGSTIMSLEIVPSAGDDTTTFAVAYHGFTSHERISLWYHPPDGSTVGLGEARANAQGRLAYSLPAAALSSGRSTIVAYGQCSGVTAVGTISIGAA